MLTWFLVVLEALPILLIPMVIGWAVDDLIKGEMTGTIKRGFLCLGLLLTGAGRRFYDTCVYSGFCKQVSNEIDLKKTT